MSFKYEVECTENVNMTSKDIPYYILRFTFPRSRQDRISKDLNHFKSFPIEMELLCTCDNFILLIDLQISPITKWEFTVKGLFHSYAHTSENEKNILRTQIIFGLSESFISK